MANDKMLIDPNKRVDGFAYNWGEGTADKWAGDLGNKASGYVQQQGAADKRAAQARNEQQSQIDRLGRIARGEQSSPAEMQLRQQNQQGQALMTSQAAGARGGFAQAMAAQRAAAMGQAASSQNLVGQAGQVRAQAQTQAQDQLADALAQQRAMDYAQREAAMRGGLNATGSQLDFIRAQDQLNQGYAELASQYKYGREAAGLQQAIQLEQRNQQYQEAEDNVAGTLFNAGASIVASGANLIKSEDDKTKKSDRRIKRDIKDGEPAARSLMDALAAHTFRYKDEADAPRRLGVMAQDLERTPEGRAIVVETPRGKAIDTAAGLGAALAGLADINRRLKRLEKR